MLRRSALRLLFVACAAWGASALAAQTARVSVQLKPGAHRLVLTTELPDGYAFNAEAPQRATAHATGLSAHPAELALTDRTAQIAIPLTVPASGEGELTVEVALYYCAEAKGSACLVDRRKLTYRIAPSADGKAGTVELPLAPLTP